MKRIILPIIFFALTSNVLVLGEGATRIPQGLNVCNSSGRNRGVDYYYKDPRPPGVCTFGTPPAPAYWCMTKGCDGLPIRVGALVRAGILDLNRTLLIPVDSTGRWRWELVNPANPTTTGRNNVSIPQLKAGVSFVAYRPPSPNSGKVTIDGVEQSYRFVIEWNSSMGLAWLTFVSVPSGCGVVLNVCRSMVNALGMTTRQHFQRMGDTACFANNRGQIDIGEQGPEIPIPPGAAQNTRALCQASTCPTQDRAFWIQYQ